MAGGVLCYEFPSMNILLTNDDGYAAPGLRAAFEAVRELGTVHVVAPRTECSACSHAITLRRTISVDRIEHDLFGTVYRTSGSPADCVRLGVAELIDRPVDLVVSGINRGANAGVDTFYSGTVAAAREAAFMGIKSIAVSQAIRKDIEVDWDVTARAAQQLIKRLADEPLPGPGFFTVNFPAPLTLEALDSVQRVPVAMHPTPLSFDRSSDGDGDLGFVYGAQYWSREVNGVTDYTVIRDGGIAVCAVPLLGKF